MKQLRIIEDEWEEDEEVTSFGKQEREALEKEIEELKGFHNFAISIEENAKGQALVAALKIGFEKARSIGANEKAIVFTESRKTQEYIIKKLSKTQYGRGGIVLFNGANADDSSKNIYEKWKEKNKHSDVITGSKTADMRSALVDYFKNKAQIMIATEAASEGINLQFCSLVVNYDLPWNPQRIEQRIGRCHRYGQKHDVVVINFLNRKNAADKRVFELLEQKFHLFEGVFGASDEVLGAIESSVDFEKRVFEIYQKCRSDKEIEEAFNELQEKMSSSISEGMRQAKQNLIENFDEEVIEKLRVSHKNGKDYFNKHQKMFWRLSNHILGKYADFHEGYQFTLKPNNPFHKKAIPAGTYKMVNEGNNIENAHIYRLGHPLALEVFERAKQEKPHFAHVVFVYKPPPKINALKSIIDKSGHLELRCLEIKSFGNVEEHLIISGVTDDGQSLEEESCGRIFSLCAFVKESSKEYGLHDNILNMQYNEKKHELVKKIDARNAKFFEQQTEKLDFWVEDKKLSLKNKLEQIDRQIVQFKNQEKESGTTSEKLSFRKKINTLEKSRKKEWKRYDEETIKIQESKDELVSQTEQQMKMEIKEKVIFKIKWSIIKEQ